MASKEDLTVVIVNWNTKNHLLKCIGSFRSEGVDEKSIIVVDQRSHDGSIDAVTAEFPRVQVLIGEEEAGYGQAVNAAFRMIRTELFVVANADVVVESGCLGTMARVVRNDRRVGLAGCVVKNTGGKAVTRFTRLSIARALLLEIIPHQWRGLWRDISGLFHKSGKVFEVTYVEGAFMMLRSTAFEAVGGFDAGFSFFFEDADLPVRMRKTQFKVLHVSDAFVMHVGSASFSQAPLRHAAEFHRNFIRFYQRHAWRRGVWLRRFLIAVFGAKYLCLRIASFVPAVRTSAQSRLETVTVKMQSLKCEKRMLVRGTEPRVSVIIPTADRPDSLRHLLTSLGVQTYRPAEVIIVDQGSDSHDPVLESALVPGITMRVFKSALNGRPTAKNIGIFHATGEILLFCDDDFVAPPDLISVHVNALMDSAIGGLSCRHTEPGLPELRSQRILRVTWYGRLIDGYQSDVTCAVGTLAGPNMSFRRDTLKVAGFFESCLTGTSIFEEPELSQRIRNCGFKLLFTNQTTGLHLPQINGNRSIRQARPVQYYRDFHHNELVYFMKNRNHSLLLFVIPFCFLRSMKQAFIHRTGVFGGMKMFLGVFEGMITYYRFLG